MALIDWIVAVAASASALATGLMAWATVQYAREATLTRRELVRQRERQELPSFFATEANFEDWGAKTLWPVGLALVNNGPYPLTITGFEVAELVPPLKATAYKSGSLAHLPVHLSPGEMALVDFSYVITEAGRYPVNVYFVYGPLASYYRLETEVSVERVPPKSLGDFPQHIVRIDELPIYGKHPEHDYGGEEKDS